MNANLPWRPGLTSSAPLVSVILFCRNSEGTLRRSIESLVNQTYNNFEYVVQDAASSDGTLDILRSYSDRLNIQLVSAPDNGPADGFWRALQRCKGEIVATCLSDEELMPDALEQAVRIFMDRPYLGAITGDAYVVDGSGRILSTHKSGPFSFARYLAAEYCPYWSSSFFSMRALRSVGIFDERWSVDSLEFEVWCRLAEDYEIAYLPNILSKYAIHEAQLSNQGARALVELESRLAIMREHVFRPDGVFGRYSTEWKERCVLLQQINLLQHLLAYKRPEAETLKQQLMGNAHLFEYLSGGDPAHPRMGLGHRYLMALYQSLPVQLRSRVTPKQKAILRRLLQRIPRVERTPLTALLRRGRTPALDSDFCLSVRRYYAPLIGRNADIGADFFEGRGQIESALAEWQAAARLSDHRIDSKACQALLKSANATDESRLLAQKEWASNYALTPSSVESFGFVPYDGDRRLTVGYVCAWWGSATIKGQAIPFIVRHDKAKFRLIAYSLEECDSSITKHFDEFRVIKKLSDREFINLVRKDAVDVLVELTGFSPHHRFAAFGARCAPVQISYLNHAGTCGVENVDYVIADEVAAPPGIEQFYSERVLRLPGTFFNFNFESDDFPDSGPAPCLKNGYVTFGCFGSQSKINDAQIYMWAHLLHAIPSSMLFLRNRGLDEERDRAFMLRRFTQWGVAPSRLRLQAGGSRSSILESYREVDISLDTWPYNGGNTIAESLWQGVPVLTIRGNSFVSRYGSSLLKASGCEEHVARDLDDLISRARQLSSNRDELIRLRRELREMMKEFGFSDSERFCRSWETALHVVARQVASSTRESTTGELSELVGSK